MPPISLRHPSSRRAGSRCILPRPRSEFLSQCNNSMMRGTKGGAAHYLHCLPADVTDVSCAAGEVSKAVFEKARLGTYREASHKPFIVAALILLTRFAEPEALLTRWAGERRPKR